MKKIREILTKIKQIQGIKTDRELAQRIGIPLATMRSWIQQNSIRKQLMHYCNEHNISLDDVVLGKPIFSASRCADCKIRHSCNEYRPKGGLPVSVFEAEDTVHIDINGPETEEMVYEIYKDGRVLSSTTIQTEDLQKIIIGIKRRKKKERE